MVRGLKFLTAALAGLGWGLGFAVSAPAPALAAATFDRLVVFGDSLSDNGNAGRFSNGPVWAEQLAERLGLRLAPASQGGSNFAVGGARLDPRSGPYSLRAQADLFLRQPAPNGPSEDRTLYVVFGGGNDLLAAVGAPNATAMVDAAVASAAGIVTDLARRGATDILVPNMPDVGMTPAIRGYGDAAVAEGGRLSARFNDALDRALAEFAAAPDLRLYRLDVWAMAQRARANPEAFGFVDAVTPCSGRGNCEGYIFWDGVHPTTAAHGRLADAAYNVLNGEAAAQ